MGRLQGQVVIVTGASAGIGQATGLRLARAGAIVVLAARRLERLDQLKSEIEAAGGRAVAVACDVTVPEERQRLVDESVAVTGRIAALVNNAGYGQRGPIELVPLDRIRANFETNFFSVVGLTQLVIPLMRRQGSGRIVNVSSVAGRIARPLSSVYDATKHALEAVSDGMRLELAPFGVKVVLVEPGFIITEFLEVASDKARPIVEQDSPYKPFFAGLAAGYERMRRMAGTADDIATVIEKALVVERPRARYAAPRHARTVIALKRWLPSTWFDRLLARQAGIGAATMAAPSKTAE